MAAKLFAPAPEPKTPLGRYRIMASTAGVRVSPLQLGAMSIGEAWSEAMGSMNKEQSFKLLDAFVDAGGNMIDTANNYQNGESELWIGEWMKERKNRDLMVIATKFTTGYVNFEVSDPQRVNFTGNSRRSLHMSVRDSLKKLQTDWIDVLYIHWWDFTTSIEELMDALHILVQQGKVLYLGISDSPAWIVSAANTYARHHGKTPFSIYQGQWHVGLRDLERDIIPCCRHFGMAIAPWGVLGSGHYQSKKALDERKKAGETLRSFRGADQSEQEIKMSEALAEVAEEHGIESVTAIALAYVFSKYPNVYPIVGGRKVEHLHDNIKALSIQLTDAQVKRLEEVKPFDIGFPTTMIGSDPALDGSHGSFLIANSAKIDYVRTPKPIGHDAHQSRLKLMSISLRRDRHTAPKMSSSSAAMWLLSQGSKASTEITARSMRARSLQTSASRLAPEDEAPRKKRIGLISRLRTSVTSRLGFTGQSITSELEQEQLRERVAAGKANPFEQLLALPPKELEALTADRLTAPSLIRNKPVEVPKQTMSTPWFRHSHRKLNDLARLIAGRHVDDAIHQMEFSQKLASKRIKPVLLEAKRRALAKNIPAETLVVSQSWVDKGSKTKVIDIRGRGKHGVIEHADTRLKLILQEGKKTDQKRLDKVSLLLKKRLRTGPGRVQTNRPIINGGAFAANAYNW